MTPTRRRIAFILMLLFLPGLWSCAQMGEWVSQKNAIPTTPAPAEETSRPSADPSVRASALISIQDADLAQKQMDAGRYQKALDLYDLAHRRSPQDQELLHNYMASVEKIRSDAQQAMDQQDYVSAGLRYAVLSKSYKNFERFNTRLSFDANDLDENWTLCKKNIPKQGFEAYRNGDLDEAIALWEALLEIDPGNTEIQDVLRIARMQQKNLQE